MKRSEPVRGVCRDEEAHLYEKVKATEVVVAAGRRVAPHDLLAVNLNRDGDMLANGKPEHVLGVGKREPVAAQVRE